MILSIVYKAVSNFFHFSAENSYLYGIHKIIALAELIGIATPQKNGLLSKDGFFPVQDTSPDDANDVNNGIYRINSKSTNYPYENTNGLIVGFTTQNGYLRGQICFTIWPETVYFRTKGDSWGAWKQIS